MIHEDSLLRTYAEERSEEIFQAIVTKHLRLVYGTALRQTGDRLLAEEITQNVFIALARKPDAIRHETTLANWLYKAALYQANQSLRSEWRRRRREQIAFELETMTRKSSDPLEEVLPLLDEGILSLRDTDRVAILLRYFDGKTFIEVGRDLGVGEDAARKRVAKAIDSLTEFFRRRGFAVSATALVSPLILDLSMPVGMAATVASAAYQSKTVPTLAGLLGILMKLMLKNKPQTIVLGCALVAVPIALRVSHSWAAEGSSGTDATTRETAVARSAKTNLIESDPQATIGPADTSSSDRALPPLEEAAVHREAGEIAARGFYPWSEDSTYTRVPKELLQRISIPSFNNVAWRVPTVSDSIAHALAMDAQESERVRALWDDSLRRFAALQSAHMKPIEPLPPVQADGPKVAETRRFQITPFANEAEKLVEDYRSELSAILGSQRAELFWLNGSNAVYANLLPFDIVRPRPVFTVVQNGPPSGTITYRLFSQEDPASGAKYGQIRREPGGPLRESADSFEPAIIQPILATWRGWMRDGTFPGPFRVELTSPQSRLGSARSPEAPGWDDRVDYVDLPKALIPELSIPALFNADLPYQRPNGTMTVDNGAGPDEISPEAISFFGLAASERQGILDLFKEMNGRFKELERVHFQRVAPNANEFVIRAFPGEMAGLKQWWMDELGAMLGTNRAALIANAFLVSSGYGTSQLSRRAVPETKEAFDGSFILSEQDMKRRQSPDWRRDGINDIFISVTRTPSPNGVIYQRFSIQGGAVGRNGGYVQVVGNIPERVRHLLTQEMIDLPFITPKDFPREQ